MKELLKLAQAALASVVIQVAAVIQSAGPLAVTGKHVLMWLIGAIVIRVAGYFVGKFAPSPSA